MNLKKIISVLPKPFPILLYKIKFIDRIFGMTTKEEQEYYKKSVKVLKDKNGAIVDLGCWLGATTIALAKGISDIGRHNQEKIYAFDIFIWNNFMNQYNPFLSRNYKPGENFKEETELRLKNYKDLVNLIEADLSTFQWKNGNIKFLLVDAMKTRELTKSITVSFFPYLLKDSIVVQQDFKHYSEPWLHIIQFRLKEYFDFDVNIKNGGTVAFKTKKTIPVEVAEKVASFDTISNAEIDEAFKFSSSLVRENEKSIIAAAHVFYYANKNDLETTEKVFDAYKNSLTSFNGDFLKVQKIVEKKRANSTKISAQV